MPSPDLLAKYLANEASPAERAEVEAWAGSDPGHSAELALLRAAWSARPAARDWNVDAAWSRVDARLGGTTVTPLPSRSRWAYSPLMKIAAGVVLVAGLAYAWQSLTPSPAAEAYVVATVAAEQRTVDLADGSRVVLAPASELRVAEGYGGRTRTVELTGEAVFTVVHDDARPFEVRARGTVTRDVGTVFLVRARGDSVVTVAVLEGAASLRPSDADVASATTLNANDVGTLRDGAAIVDVTRSAAVDALAAWTAGRLEFVDTPLRTVAAELERWYGVHVQFDNAQAADRLVSAPLPTNDIAEVITVLEQLLGVRIARTGDTLVVR